MKVEVKSLLNKLEMLKPLVGTSNIVESFKNVNFTNSAIEVFNGGQSLSFSYQLPYSVAVDNKLFLELLKKVSTPEIDMRQSSGKLEVISNYNSFKIPISDQVISPDTQFDFEDGIDIKVIEDLITGLESVLFLTDESAEREYARGVILEATIDDSYLYTTDGIIAAAYQLDPLDLSKNVRIHIPKLFCETLVKLFKKFDNIVLRIGQQAIRAEFDEGVLCSFLTLTLTGIPNVKYVMDGLYAKSSQLNPIKVDLMQVIEQAAIISKSINIKALVLKSEACNILRASLENDQAGTTQILDVSFDYSFDTKFEVEKLKKIVSIDSQFSIIDNNFYMKRGSLEVLLCKMP